MALADEAGRKASSLMYSTAGAGGGFPGDSLGKPFTRWWALSQGSPQQRQEATALGTEGASTRHAGLPMAPGSGDTPQLSPQTFRALKEQASRLVPPSPGHCPWTQGNRDVVRSTSSLVAWVRCGTSLNLIGTPLSLARVGFNGLMFVHVGPH